VPSPSMFAVFCGWDFASPFYQVSVELALFTITAVFSQFAVLLEASGPGSVNRNLARRSAPFKAGRSIIFDGFFFQESNDFSLLIVSCL